MRDSLQVGPPGNALSCGRLNISLTIRQPLCLADFRVSAPDEASSEGDGALHREDARCSLLMFYLTDDYKMPTRWDDTLYRDE